MPTGLTRFAWLSIGAALVTIVLKALAWWLTGSVGLLSDALESLVNLAGATMALAMLSIAARPADAGHEWGHGKAEYFSSAFEGVLIAVAAAAIVWAAVGRLLAPRALEAVGIGLAVSVVASIVNLVTARVLVRAARDARSIALEADAQHLMADVWTSAGVIAGVALVAATGWLWLDPAIAIAVAVNVLWTGWKLARRSAAGLMDAALPADERSRIDAVLSRYRARGLDFHALRTRQAGARSFITMHVLVPGRWTVQQAHDVAERIEADVRGVVPNAHVTTHVEPIEDPASHRDTDLDAPAS